MRLLLTTHATLGTETRIETFMGRDFMVAPVVMVQSQVLVNNVGATFLPPAHITDQWAEMWEGRPIVTGDHPQDAQGKAISANAVSVFNEKFAGYVFHAYVERDGIKKRLKGEAYLDVGLRKTNKELDIILKRLQDGKPVEVSTGFPAIAANQTGMFDGESYAFVIDPVGADHLAIFANLTGACSVEDGCGLGVNCAGSCSCGSKQKETDDMKNNASPEDSGAPPVAEEAAPAVVNTDPAQTAVEDGSALRKLLSRFADLFRVPQAQNESDEDRRRLVYYALQEAFGGPGRDIWIEAVFSDSNQVVFCIVSQGDGTQMYQSEFSLDDDGNVSLSDPVAVRQVTTFVPVSNSEPEGTQESEVEMDPKVQTAANADDKPTPGEAPNGAEAPVLAAVSTLTETVNKLAESLTALGEKVEATNAQVKALEAAAAPVVAEQERHRTGLIEALSANSRNQFEKTELEAMPTRALEKLHGSLIGVNYAGAGGPRQATVVNAEELYAPPVPYFADAKDNAKGGN